MIHPEAKYVFEIFSQLNMIPRPSWHEERVADFLCDFARQLSLPYRRDARNCVVISKPATKGYEHAAPVALLNHSDMVCVAKEGVDYAPLTSPIRAYTQNGWIMAHGSSLGADNGIGLAMALAVLKSIDIPHPALEVVTTSNEEDGMTGAANLSKDFLSARRIINLDSEDYDTITLGSAGALLQSTVIPFSLTSIPCGHCLWRVRITGGLGGHSGVDIGKHRTNANWLMACFLHRVLLNDRAMLVNISGGNANNAIANVCEATIACCCDDVIARLADDYQRYLTAQYGAYEKDLRISLERLRDVAGTEMTGIDYNTSHSVIRALHLLPNGPLAMSKTISGTVETSNNTGCIRTEAGHLSVSNYSRSFCEESLHRLGNDVRSILAEAGGESKVIMRAPAWLSPTDTPFIRLAEDVFADVLGFRPRKVAMHFALEAGFFMEKYPGVEMISIGPKIIDPHSTAERVSVGSVNDIWAVLKEMLSRMR